MVREKLNAEEIQSIVKAQIDSIREVHEDNADIRVPLPTRTEPDSSGCNWAMTVFGNTTGYEASIKKLVSWARSQFNLK